MIDNKGSIAVNNFEEYFDYLYELDISEKLRKVCNDVKNDVLRKHKSVDIPAESVVFYRGRSATAKELANASRGINEVKFWEDYLTVYFSREIGFLKRIMEEPCLTHPLPELYFNEITKNNFSKGFWGYDKENSGAPPLQKCDAQRCNGALERVLYLSDSIETCLLELNANWYGTYSIGEFINKTQLKIYDFVASDNTYEQEWMSQIFSQPAQNKSEQKKIYMKSQIITRLIREEGFDGVKYQSAKEPNASCYAFFDPEKFDCTKSYLVRTTKVTIEYKGGAGNAQ